MEILNPSNNFIQSDRAKPFVKYLLIEKPKAIGKKDRKGKITYVPQFKSEPKWKVSKTPSFNF